MLPPWSKVLWTHLHGPRFMIYWLRSLELALELARAQACASSSLCLRLSQLALELAPCVMEGDPGTGFLGYGIVVNAHGNLQTGPSYPSRRGNRRKSFFASGLDIPSPLEEEPTAPLWLWTYYESLERGRWPWTLTHGPRDYLEWKFQRRIRALVLAART